MADPIQPGDMIEITECGHADVPRGTVGTFIGSYVGGFRVSVHGRFRDAYDGSYSYDIREVFVTGCRPVVRKSLDLACLVS